MSAAGGSQKPEPSGAEPTRAEREARLRARIAAAPVLLCMQGTPSAPSPGFSSASVAFLRSLEVAFEHHDVSREAEERYALAAVAQHPGLPLLFVSGACVGDHDEVLARHAAGELSLPGAQAGT